MRADSVTGLFVSISSRTGRMPDLAFTWRLLYPSECPPGFFAEFI